MNTTFFHLITEQNGYLSNWYPSKFVLEGENFSCVEQYMMWKKAKIFEDYETAHEILNTTDPATMKKLDDPERIDRTKWRGQNLLGMILEDVYNTLKDDKVQNNMGTESCLF